MELNQAFKILAEDSLLSSVPQALGQALEGAATLRTVKTGALVCAQGKPANRLIIPVERRHLSRSGWASWARYSSTRGPFHPVSTVAKSPQGDTGRCPWTICAAGSESRERSRI